MVIRREKEDKNNERERKGREPFTFGSMPNSTKRERGGVEGVEYDIPTRFWPLLALQFCDQASLVVFSGCLRTLKEDTGRGSL